MKDKYNRTVVIFFAHHIEHVPPPLNVATELGRQGYKVYLIGYRKYGVPRYQKLGPNVLLFRMDLRSSGIKIGFIRKVCVLLEFIAKAKKITHKISPRYLITFNEVASLLNAFRFPSVSRKYNWQLEFPESETGSIFEILLKKYSVRSWKYADVMIFPTQVRFSMGAVLDPGIIRKKVMVVHNAPLNTTPGTSGKLDKRLLSEPLEFLHAAECSGRRSILYTGAVGNRYGWSTIIKAVAGRNDFVLLILGIKHELGEREFCEAIQDAKYPENVRWLEPVPYRMLQDILKEGDIGFVTYRGDTLNTRFSAPGKLYEYLKAGLYILTDENACIGSELKEANCGQLFPSQFDESTLNRVLDTLIETGIAGARQRSIDLFSSRFAFEKQLEPLMDDLCKLKY